MRHHKIFKHIKNKNKKIFVFSINDGEIRDSEGGTYGFKKLYHWNLFRLSLLK